MDAEEQVCAETVELGYSGEYEIYRPEDGGSLSEGQIQGQGQQKQHLARGNLWKPYYEHSNIDES